MDTPVPNPPGKPGRGLIFKKIGGPESVLRPQYAKWREALLASKPVRVETDRGRSIIFIPSASFEDNGFMPEGTLIVAYGGSMKQGYVELDFTKFPNPFWLFQKGFPIEVGTLICKTIYAMFPHLSPLTPAEAEILKEHVSQTRGNKAVKFTKLGLPKPKNKPGAGRPKGSGKKKADPAANLQSLPKGHPLRTMAWDFEKGEWVYDKSPASAKTEHVFKEAEPQEQNQTQPVAVEVLPPEQDHGPTNPTRSARKEGSHEASTDAQPPSTSRGRRDKGSRRSDSGSKEPELPQSQPEPNLPAAGSLDGDRDSGGQP